MTTTITNSGQLGLLRIDVQNRTQHPPEWTAPQPFAFVYPGCSIEAPIGPFTRAIVALRAIERAVDPTCAVAIESKSRVHVTVEHAEVKDKVYVRKSVEHNCTRSVPYLTLQDRAILEYAHS